MLTIDHQQSMLTHQQCTHFGVISSNCIFDYFNLSLGYISISVLQIIYQNPEQTYQTLGDETNAKFLDQLGILASNTHTELSFLYIRL